MPIYQLLQTPESEMFHQHDFPHSDSHTGEPRADLPSLHFVTSPTSLANGLSLSTTGKEQLI